MKLAIDWQQAAEIVGGRLISLNPGERFDDFVMDSRLVKEGSIFWTLRGKNHDAHNFLDAVIRSGASGIIIERGKAQALQKKPRHILETDDTLKALQRLAAWHRLRWKIPVAAVTGTNGKSTTKEMLRAILSTRGPACANKGNLNNQYGAPLSLLEMGPEHRSAVFELGASQRGDIQETGMLVRPDAGVITCVGPAHLEFFGNLEMVYQTKIEMAKCLAKNGTLIYNIDDPLLVRLNTEWKGRRLTFGQAEAADIRVAQSDDFALIHNNQRHELPVELLPHNRLNAAGAACAALALGWSWEEIERGLLSWQPLPMRMQVERRGKSKFILDAYNANPSSMRAALTALAQDKSNQRPLVAVLGDMKELGNYSQHYHAELGKWLGGLDIDRIFLAGPEMAHAFQAAKDAGSSSRMEYALTPSGWQAQLAALAKAGGTFLLKASRSMEFEKILEKI